MTEEEYIENHRKTWRWIENKNKKGIDVEKHQYFSEKKLNSITFNCFACGYCDVKCSGCLFLWLAIAKYPKSGPEVCCCSSYYAEWADASLSRNSSLAAESTGKISNLELNPNRKMHVKRP